MLFDCRPPDHVQLNPNVDPTFVLDPTRGDQNSDVLMLMWVNDKRQLHRNEDMPAAIVICQDSDPYGRLTVTMQWYERGTCHRDDEPASLYGWGGFADEHRPGHIEHVWIDDGRVHRDRGPARISWMSPAFKTDKFFADTEWRRYGELHRAVGPAKYEEITLGSSSPETFVWHGTHYEGWELYDHLQSCNEVATSTTRILLRCLMSEKRPCVFRDDIVTEKDDDRMPLYEHMGLEDGIDRFCCRLRDQWDLEDPRDVVEMSR